MGTLDAGPDGDARGARLLGRVPDRADRAHLLDLSTPQGRLVASLMASLAEFEHDLLRERVRSGIAAAKARGQAFGRRAGHRPSDKVALEVLRLVREEGFSQRQAAERLGISKTTVNGIVKRSRQQGPGSGSPGA